MTPDQWSGETADVTPEEAAEIDRVIAGNVRATRARLRMTQLELADALDWSRPAVGSLESGTRRTSVADAIALCHALKVDLSELLRGAEPDALRDLGL
jgi:transcriptional regulator with XRE-family HTH domain